MSRFSRKLLKSWVLVIKSLSRQHDFCVQVGQWPGHNQTEIIATNYWIGEIRSSIQRCHPENYRFRIERKKLLNRSIFYRAITFILPIGSSKFIADYVEYHHTKFRQRLSYVSEKRACEAKLMLFFTRWTHYDLNKCRIFFLQILDQHWMSLSHLAFSWWP